MVDDPPGPPPEPPTVIIPTLRCWRWYARQVHDPHTFGDPPNTRRCDGIPSTVEQASEHDEQQQ